MLIVLALIHSLRSARDETIGTSFLYNLAVSCLQPTTSIMVSKWNDSRVIRPFLSIALLWAKSFLLFFCYVCCRHGRNTWIYSVQEAWTCGSGERHIHLCMRDMGHDVFSIFYFPLNFTVLGGFRIKSKYYRYKKTANLASKSAHRTIQLRNGGIPTQ